MTRRAIIPLAAVLLAAGGCQQLTWGGDTELALVDRATGEPLGETAVVVFAYERLRVPDWPDGPAESIAMQDVTVAAAKPPLRLPIPRRSETVVSGRTETVWRDRWLIFHPGALGREIEGLYEAGEPSPAHVQMTRMTPETLRFDLYRKYAGWRHWLDVIDTDLLEPEFRAAVYAAMLAELDAWERKWRSPAVRRDHYVNGVERYLSEGTSSGLRAREVAEAADFGERQAEMVFALRDRVRRLLAEVEPT